MAAICFLFVNVALHLIDLILSFVQVVILPGTVTEDLLRLGEMNWFDVVKALNSLLTIFALVATAVAFLMWLHRASKNLRHLGAADTEYSSGLAVGSFFIPFANLVIPYRAVKEIWVRSDPRLAEPGEESWQQSGSSSLLGWWWGLWIVSNFVSQAVFRLNLQAETYDQLFNLAKVEIVADAFTIIAAVLAIMVVRGIDRRQELRHKTHQENFLPPPPPIFSAQQS